MWTSYRLSFLMEAVKVSLEVGLHSQTSVRLNTDGLNYKLQNWSEVFHRELDQLQTWKDHSPHKIAHTSDTTTSSAGPPNQAWVQRFSRRTHRTHWKLSYSRLWFIAITNKNLLEDSWSTILSHLSLPLESSQCCSTDIGMWLHMEYY